jgi:tetratricopeptide (TPR) repeat protein
LNYLFQSAKQRCELACGDIGTILYLEKNEINEALKWFKKAGEADCLFAPAAYYYGLLLVVEKGEWSQSLKYLQKAAREGYEMAYGELGSVLYLEKAEVDEAEKWFKKAEKAGCLHAPHAYDYGMLLIEERGDIEGGTRYLDKAAEDGY